MRAGAERQARIEFDEHGRKRLAVSGWRLVRRELAARTNPQPLAETHGLEVFEPLAFPDAISQCLEACFVQRLRQLGAQGLQDLLGIEVVVKQGFKTHAWPQRRRSG